MKKFKEKRFAILNVMFSYFIKSGEINLTCFYGFTWEVKLSFINGDILTENKANSYFR